MGCYSKKDKNDLIRIVKNKQNEVIIDKTGKQEGKGAYICKRQECLDKVIKSKRLDKVLETKISEEFYNNLKNIINGGEFIGKN